MSRSIRVGTKVSAAEAAKNPSRIVKLAEQPIPEVEGQYPHHLPYYQCPGCGAVFRISRDGDELRYYQCPKCGNLFRA